MSLRDVLGVSQDANAFEDALCIALLEGEDLGVRNVA